MIRALGWIKDPKDKRDFHAIYPQVRLPEAINWGKKLLPVRDQGAEGTCVGFASAATREAYITQAYKAHLSPRYIYNECKKIDLIPDQEGTYIRCAAKVLANPGAIWETCWPYSPNQKDKPCVGFLECAKKQTIKRYARIPNTIEGYQSSLFIRGPFVVGITCFQGIFDAPGGVIPMPKPGEQSAGGHAICVVGFDNKRKWFIFKNSWGTGWGYRGFGYIPYSYMTKYASDGWEIQAA